MAPVACRRICECNCAVILVLNVQWFPAAGIPSRKDLLLALVVHNECVLALQSSQALIRRNLGFYWPNLGCPAHQASGSVQWERKGNYLDFRQQDWQV